MYFRFYLLLLFSTLLGNCTFAQDQSNEVAVGVFGLSSIAYKRVTGNQALRFSLSLRSNSTSFNVGSATTNPTSSLILSGGYEWRKVLSNQFRLYYGGDLTISRGSNRVDYVPTNSISSASRTTFGLGIKPFLGIQYRFTSNFFLLTEVSTNLFSYSSEKEVTTLRNSSSQTITVDSGTTSIGISPSYLLGVGFAF